MKLNRFWRIGVFFSWILWMIKLRVTLPIEVGYVSNRELTKEEYEYPLKEVCGGER